ncbi:hypothetical protein D9M72_199550 [compost metagenome]
MDRERRVNEGDIEALRMDFLHARVPKAAIKASCLGGKLHRLDRWLVHVHAIQAVRARVRELQQAGRADRVVEYRHLPVGLPVGYRFPHQAGNGIGRKELRQMPLAGGMEFAHVCDLLGLRAKTNDRP